MKEKEDKFDSFPFEDENFSDEEYFNDEENDFAPPYDIYKLSIKRIRPVTSTTSTTVTPTTVTSTSLDWLDSYNTTIF